MGKYCPYRAIFGVFMKEMDTIESFKRAIINNLHFEGWRLINADKIMWPGVLSDYVCKIQIIDDACLVNIYQVVKKYDIEMTDGVMESLVICKKSLRVNKSTPKEYQRVINAMKDTGLY